ncbi:MAG: hypothetical protein AMK69_03060 [Nitrospira bacterium SG8_3]|nr:MAG: hypothetical protein AMK69_03060 [Nitrospira bacterium SG8_3]
MKVCQNDWMDSTGLLARLQMRLSENAHLPFDKPFNSLNDMGKILASYLVSNNGAHKFLARFERNSRMEIAGMSRSS